jgi:hypothetical protein
MQAQHKAVMKELKRGGFDDKIDQYLGGTEGLLPRGVTDAAEEPADPGRGPLARSSQRLRAVDGADGEVGPLETTVLDGELAISREPTLEEPAIGLRPTEQAVESIAMSRTKTAERTSRPSQVKTSLPTGGASPKAPAAAPAAPAQGAVAQAAPAVQTAPVQAVPVQVVPEEAAATLQSAVPVLMEPRDSQPEILIQLEVDEVEDPPTLPRRRDEVDKLPKRRRPSDSETGWDMTQIDIAPMAEGLSGALTTPVSLRNASDPSGPVFSPVGASPATGPISQRTAKAVGAAALPPARPITRPPSRPALTPPPVARQQVPEDRRTPPPEPVEVYAPTPTSSDQSPTPERPGQYSQHKKISTRIPPGDTMPERLRPIQQQHTLPQGSRPGSTPVISPPARPGSSQGIPQPQSAQRSSPVVVPMPARPGTPPPTPPPPPQRVTPPPPPRASTPIPQQGRPGTAAPAAQASQSSPARPSGAVPPQRAMPIPIPSPTVRPSPETRPRTPTPPRVAAAQAGAAPGAAGGAPSGRAPAPSPSSGVVVTRPAVIVGAPTKPSATTAPRIRKAREDEGRGFGQGLISEKSLDEVILAYLSEDAEDK